MRIVVLIIFIGLFSGHIYSQNNVGVLPEIQTWQKLTISIGTIDQKEYNNKLYNYYRVLGSGMIAYIKYKDTPVPVIITAKHVIQNNKKEYLDTIRVRFSWENEKSFYNHLGYRIPLKEQGLLNYFTLPDTSIDLACIPLGFSIDSIQAWGNGNGKILAYSKFATDKDHFEGREIYTIGYPAGIGTEYLTKGLVRKGIISWLPDKDVEQKKFLIDCNVYPGNSGGPVFSFPAIGTIVLDTAIMVEKFFGIVVQRRFNYNEIFEMVDKKAKRKSEYLSPESMGVGVVEPAKNVLKLLRFTEEIVNKY